MTIFAILMPRPQPALAEKLVLVFKTDTLKVTETQWLVSDIGTTQEISAKLGIYDPGSPTLSPVGEAIVFATSGYFGRAPANIWEWIKVKLEVVKSA
jgi:hypothetical protein